MNNYKKIIYFIILFFIFNLENVNAARELCTTDVFSNMRAKAYKTTFSYELKFDSVGAAYFEIYYYNLNEGIEIHYGENVYKYSENDSNGVINTLFQNTGETYEFELYSEYGYPCVGELLYTKKVTLPKYNKYSELEPCIEYEEFPLCNKWYKGEIVNEDYFYEKLNEYIDNLKENVDEKPIIKNETFIQKILRLYIENLIITLPITILIFIFILFKVIKNIIRKRNRIKIDI